MSIRRACAALKFDTSSYHYKSKRPETSFNPAYDAAVRDWARTSAKVERAVRRVDDQRIALIQEIFEGFGYRGVEALVRARITYFHQVGYYALRIKESRADRLRLKAAYLRALKT